MTELITAGRRNAPMPARAALWLALLALLLLVGMLPREAGAQQAPAASDAEIADLVQKLEDPAQRAQLIRELRALRAADEAAAKAAEAAQPPRRPNAEAERSTSRGASAIRRMSDTLGRLAGHVVELGQAIAALPDAASWLVREWTSEPRRAVWFSFLWRLAAVIGGGLVASLIAHYALTRPRRALERRPRPRAYLRPPLLLSYNILRLVPALCFVGAGYGLLALLDPSEVTRLVAITAINAHLIASIVTVVGYQGLAPYTPNLRVSGFKDETAQFCARWWRRLVALAVYGYFFCQGALLLGVPAIAYNALIKVLGIVVIALVTVLVLRIRPHVSGWLRRAAANRRSTVVSMLARRLADVWHILAIGYALAGGLVAAIGGINGFLFFVKASAASFAILWVVGFALAAVPRLWRSGVRLKEETRRRYPNLEFRLNRYIPSARNALSVIAVLAAFVLILEAWSVDVLTWLASDLGALLVGKVAAVVAIIIIALVVWELLSTLIDRHLARLEQEGRAADHRYRGRTLLPLARNAVRIVVTVIAVLMILDQIGIDVAPILAGVGVVGLAVGFGAQTLVKDVITGIFIVVEDSLAIGDVVEVAGRSGVVEDMTIRMVRVRDLEGNLHTVPYSAIDTVTNMTKEFAFFVADIAVPHGTDTDKVAQLMLEVDADMRADPEFAGQIYEPLTIFGVERFNDASVVVRGRMKTAPGKQWGIKRAYFGRLIQVFAKHGIEFGVTGAGVVLAPPPPRAAQLLADRTGAHDDLDERMTRDGDAGPGEDSGAAPARS
ncbi:MAG: mechanosensitive ion channel domain-containing protein [Alphaproteobacteria bacterium]